jgi:PilZ domain
MENDRRSYPRVRCNCPAALDLGADQPTHARIVDLSAEGCHLLFDSPQDIRRGTEMLMTFEVENIPFGVRAQAKSIRSDTSVGIYFPEMIESNRADLQALVSLMAQFTPQPGAIYA